MNNDKLNIILNNNDIVIKRLNNENNKSKEEKIKFLETQNRVINDYLENNNIKSIKKLSYKRIRDIFSSIINNTDKKVHNAVFKNNILWDLYRKNYNDRYDNTESHYTRGMLISFVMIFIGMISPVMDIVGIICLLNCIIKYIKTKYNVMNYGVPKIEREYFIQKDTWLNNIKTSIYKYNKQKALTDKSMPKKINVVNEEDRNNIIDELDNFGYTEKNIENVDNLVNNCNNIDKYLDYDREEKYEKIIKYLNELVEQRELINSINSEISDVNYNDMNRNELEILYDKLNNSKDKLNDIGLERFNDIHTMLLRYEDNKVLVKKI